MTMSQAIARPGASVLLAMIALAGGAASVLGAAPPPLLSADVSPADIDSSYGSASFGSWIVDRFGLPAYRYEIDEATAPQAPQVEINGRTDAWHQVGNDHIVANAYNHGYVQLWSQDRLYQWANLYDEANRHFAGGYGYLRLGDRVISTLHTDRPPDAATERDFGVGYFRKLTATGDVEIEEFTYAPFGDDPLLLHDVVLRNVSAAPLQASWFEYWDVNPVIQPLHQRQRGLFPPAYDSTTKTLTVCQLPDTGDFSPLTIFASALVGQVSGFETDADAFFGSGGRAAPQAVLDDHAGNSIAPLALPLVSGHTLFVFRAPISVAPGDTVTLRFAYGAARREAIPTLVARYSSGDPLGASASGWAAWLPRASFPAAGAWLARELQWDAYMVRSGATYEETFGHHILSQGGYYQYDSGFQGAFRDPLQHLLPMILAEPELAREVIRYSAREQPAVTGFLPYAMLDLGRRYDLGTSDDLDFWLFLAVTEYVMATRDFAFLDEVIPFYDHGEASLWEHLKLAFFHQETLVGRGPHGGYVTGVTGDWSDFATEFLQMTESMLVTAQLAFAYPRLALVAERRGDEAFAAKLRAVAADLLATLGREWTGRGWFSRGYSGLSQLGHGVIYLEPQPWALLAGAASPQQSATLVANVRRFLTGIGAPSELKGPARIGSAQSPAFLDPEVEERNTFIPGDNGNHQPGVGALDSGSNNAVWVGGAWYALDLPLAWAFGELGGGARDYAWDEFLRNTLAAHASAYPAHWDGVISVDDVCHAFYQNDPSRCGTGLTTAYNTQILHQPAWDLFVASRLAGLSPTDDGLRIAPHLPFDGYSLRLPGAGIASQPGMLRGYLRPEGDDQIMLRVQLPAGTDPSAVTAWVDGTPASHVLESGEVTFPLLVHRGVAADWAVTW